MGYCPKIDKEEGFQSLLSKPIDGELGYLIGIGGLLISPRM